MGDIAWTTGWSNNATVVLTALLFRPTLALRSSGNPDHTRWRQSTEQRQGDNTMGHVIEAGALRFRHELETIAEMVEDARMHVSFAQGR
jgi:hypothetical protein